MPRQTEPNANNALGELLRGMMLGCEVRSENTQTFPDYPGRHADVLIAAPGRSPVVVEAEYEPAAEVERDASERLGLRVQGQPRTVEAAIAVRYPQVVEDAYDVRQALSEARLSYYVLHQDGSRFPESGWLEGSATDLADLARLVSVPQRAVEQVADTLEQGIGQAANRLDEMAKLRPSVTPIIARLLGMSDVPQTRRMACAIIVNAMVFHQRIAGMHQEVKTLRLVCGPNVANPQGETLTAWEDILKINYWPIFAIAKDILEQLPGDVATSILRELLETAQEVEATGVDNAGIASAFAALAHKKLKADGVLALVLPLSAAAGLSWQGFRETLAKNYTDLTVLSIAASDNDHLSFSADTGMAECLVIARKLKQSEATTETGRGHFISLGRRAQGFAHAGSLAMNVSNPERARRIEDGPYGGTALMIGDELAGESMTAPVQRDGESWGAVRLSDLSLAQTAFALAQSKLWLPGNHEALAVEVAPLDKIATLGMVHRDLTGPRPRGPFDKVAPSPTATYPSLWNHDAKNETRMVCQPDSQLRVRSAMEKKATVAWATASRAHINLDFRFNSQPLTAAFTERESMGGRAWPNVRLPDSRFDYAFTLWSNSTLGLLLYWWHSNRQHSGRGTTTIRSVESLPVLDLRALSDKQRRTSETIFNELRDIELKPAYLADSDPNRALLDRRVVRDLLGFDEKTYAAVRRLAAKWCAEPSVHGGKARPKSAQLVI